MRYDSGTITADVIDPKTKTSIRSGKFIARTMMWVGIGLAVTFAVLTLFSVPLYFIFQGQGKLGVGTLFDVIKSGDTSLLSEVELAALATYGIILIVSGIVMIGMMIWINISMIAKGKVRLVPYLIYAGTMGVFISSFSLVLPFYDLLLGIGVTTLIFGMMAGVAALLGDKVKWFGIIGIGMLAGLSLIGLISIPLWFIFANNLLFVGYYYFFTLVSFLAMLLITAFDFWRMNKIASKGSESNDLALYCAFNLYVDYIYILIRILSLLARAKSSK